MELTINSKKYNARKIAISDYEEAASKIRADKLKCLGNMASAEVTARVITAPVTNAEVSEYLDSTPGIAWLLSRCLTPSCPPADMNDFIMSQDPQVELWVRGSVGNRVKPAGSK